MCYSCVNVAECGEKNGRLINRGNRVQLTRTALRNRRTRNEKGSTFCTIVDISLREKRIRPTDGVTIDRSSAAIDRYPFAKRKYLTVVIDWKSDREDETSCCGRN